MGAAKDLWNQFERLYCLHDWDGAASLFAPDAVHVDPMGRQEGHDAIRVWCEEGGGAFSHIEFPASVLVEEGDTIVAEYVFRAKFTGPVKLPDGTVLPPTAMHRNSPASPSARSKTGSSWPCVITSMYRNRQGRTTLTGRVPILVVSTGLLC
jgi:ketosteroid isomerase-like protein